MDPRQGQLVGVRETELLLAARVGGLDGLHGDDQLPGDVTGSKTASNEREDVTLSIGQTLERRTVIRHASPVARATMRSDIWGLMYVFPVATRRMAPSRCCIALSFMM